MIPEAQTYLTFWEKFLELQIKMLITNQENVQNHNYASDPSEWPFLTRGIAYFISKESNEKDRALKRSNWPKTGSFVNIPYVIDENHSYSERGLQNIKGAMATYLYGFWIQL